MTDEKLWHNAAGDELFEAGAKVVLCNRATKKVALELVRNRTNDETYYTLAGGHIDPGETSETALRREIREETGLDYDGKFQLIKAQINPPTDNGRAVGRTGRKVVLIYQAEIPADTRFQPAGADVADFILDVKWLDSTEILSGEIQINPAYRPAILRVLKNLNGGKNDN
ncbi:MAG: NUDIX hydrolase [Candidatus Nomurabacteria bacterium]|jgi:8-oxo-dGTP pyrophosphatase MutT (NUDIX family)|nr:NUDIX hydrolase [Candidatus Nomurabacteria bacterium]